jgi:hypothetical protein
MAAMSAAAKMTPLNRVKVCAAMTAITAAISTTNQTVAAVTADASLAKAAAAAKGTAAEDLTAAALKALAMVVLESGTRVAVPPFCAL